jgi:hypothetical protein
MSVPPHDYGTHSMAHSRAVLMTAFEAVLLRSGSAHALHACQHRFNTRTLDEVSPSRSHHSLSARPRKLAQIHSRVAEPLRVRRTVVPD